MTSIPVTSLPRRLPARETIFGLAAAACLTPWVSPPLALLVGVVLALPMENPCRRQGQKASKLLLQGCVVLLGFGMDLPVVLRAGVSGFSFAAGTIATTLLLGWVAGRALGTGKRTSLLISAGTAICGGSAIAAAGSVLQAEEGEMTVAMGTVFLLNAAALFLFPFIGHSLHLSQHQFGTWAGVAIHDVSSVVGAASHYGMPALQTATAVKLSRALWIVPVCLGLALGRRKGEAGDTGRGRIQIPWFIGLFVLASVIRSFVPGVAAVSPALSKVATAGLTLTLFLIGAGLSKSTLRAVGWRALVQGLGLWAFISIASLLVILKTA